MTRQLVHQDTHRDAGKGNCGEQSDVVDNRAAQSEPQRRRNQKGREQHGVRVGKRQGCGLKDIRLEQPEGITQNLMGHPFESPNTEDRVKMTANLTQMGRLGPCHHDSEAGERSTEKSGSNKPRIDEFGLPDAVFQPGQGHEGGDARLPEFRHRVGGVPAGCLLRSRLHAKKNGCERQSGGQERQ